MTNKMRLIFVAVTIVCVAFWVLMSTEVAVDTADQILSAVGNALGLHEAPALSALAVLAIPSLYVYLCLASRRRRHL
jgi:hypothetical protein